MTLDSGKGPRSQKELGLGSDKWQGRDGNGINLKHLLNQGRIGKSSMNSTFTLYTRSHRVIQQSKGCDI